MPTQINRFDSRIPWTTAQEDTDSPVIGFVQGSLATLMVDACSSRRHAAEVRREMRAQGIKEPDYAVITHSHPDHWFGLIDFESTVAICSRVCLAKTQAMTTMDWSHGGHRRQLEAGESYEMLDAILDAEYGADRGGIALRSPDIGMRGELVIDLGGLTAVVRELEQPLGGPAHRQRAREGRRVPGRRALHQGGRRGGDRPAAGAIDTLEAAWFIDSHGDGVMTRGQVEVFLREYAASL